MDMSKNKKRSQTTQAPSNSQQELANRAITDRTMEPGIAQPHASKKVALGPNTKR